MGLGICPLLGRTLVVGQQNQCPAVVWIRRQEQIGSAVHLVLLPRLLVSPHQHFQRVLFHHAVRILGQEGFQAADLGRRILLLNRYNVGVVLRGIFDFFLLRLSLCRLG